MKTSFKKLRGLGLHRHDKRDRPLHSRSLAQLDELAQASQDMQDMRDCYDSLLSAAAATANSAYEFSESLRELGDCLLEKTALIDDEDSGRALLMLGKVQFDIQKFVDNYRSHISHTITIPSESLLNELRTVEEMKGQCDEKRLVYEDVLSRHREKGKPRSSKGETISSQQLQVAKVECDEAATLFVFRMKSLKRGQSRSLLTQAARHHAAQLYFFRKALKSLEAIEPQVKLVAELQHIDYQFSGLDDDDRASVFLTDDDENEEEDEDDSDDDCEECDDSELSFDYQRNEQNKDASNSGNSMEVDSENLTFPQVSEMEDTKENVEKKRPWSSSPFVRDLSTGSKSAPLSAVESNNLDPGERFRQMRQASGRKFHAYVLPTPLETKGPISSTSDTQIPQAGPTGPSRVKSNIWHSSPLEYKNYESILRNEKSRQSILKENSSNNNQRETSPFPHLQQADMRSALGTKKVKRQAFSGPLTSNSLRSNKPAASTGHHQLFSGPLLHTPMAKPSSTFVSSPRISELHELPRPPPYLVFKNNNTSNPVGYSAPLVPSRGAADFLAANKSLASTLPVPPQTISRSHSTPYWGPLEMTVASGTLETPQI